MEICKETIPTSRSCNWPLVREVNDLTLTEDDDTFMSDGCPASITASILPRAAPTPDIEHQLFSIASGVALDYAEDYQWSSFHSWYALEQAKSHSDTINTDTYWDSVRPFGSCLGVSTHIYHALRSVISAHPNPKVAAYADTVQLMTSTQHSDSESSYHAIIALCFATHAIIIDHALHPEAFSIPLGGEFTMHAFLPAYGPLGQERYKYFLAADDKYVLVMESMLKSAPPMSMTPMDVALSVLQLAIPAALQVKPLKGEQDVYLPPRKNVTMRALMDEEPSFIPFTPLHGRYLIDACSVQVSFEDATISAQVPRADWLDREQGKSWRGVMGEFDACVEKGETNVLVTVKLGARTSSTLSEREKMQLGMLCALVEEFGMDREVIVDMVAAVVGVWAPYRGESA